MKQSDRKRIYTEYMQMKIDEGDYHAVSDAANDLRELEVEMKTNPDQVEMVDDNFEKKFRESKLNRRLLNKSQSQRLGRPR